MRKTHLSALFLTALVACGDHGEALPDTGAGADDMTLDVELGASGPDLGVQKSIRTWAACDGVTDDAGAVAAAFAAARGGAFTLVIDCPLRVHIGSDIARPIFVESGTTVVFANGGVMTVDNVLIPAFVIANSSDVAFLD